jgi:PAS domain S-box-containing protein
MGRLRLPVVERLTARLAAGLTLLVVGPLAAGLYVLAYLEHEQAVATRRSSAELEVRLLETALRHDMLARDTRLLGQILEEIGRQPQVMRAMVIDHDGIVRQSSRPAELGIQTSRASPTCLVCHDKTPAARQRSVVIREDGIDVLRSVLPVQNRGECFGCHSSAARFNGMLVLDVSLAPVQAQFRRHVTWLAAAAAGVMLLILAGSHWHIRRLILSRLTKLGQTARTIAGGALEERAEVSGGDVIASLAADFNAMADATAGLVAEVEQREQQMAGVLNSLDDGLILLNRDLTIVAANRALAKWHGVYPEMLRGRTCREVAGHDLPCREDPCCPTARCLASGRLQQATYRLPADGGGEERVYEIYASPVYSPDGSVGQVVEAWRDITDRVREEERLAEIERLSSLGILASGLSHEVNTPLATVLTCAEAIVDRLPEGSAPLEAETADAVREGATVIREQVLRCRTITDQFLRFARGIPPATEPIDLPYVVEGVMALARPTAREAGVSLVFRPNGSVPLVTANTEVVQHVVLNLLVNAIESCSEGGRVVVSLLADDHVRLQVHDNGCGISPEAQRRLFEPFRTGKPRGTGLGLFLSRTFMRRFHGDVRLVESVVGQGSCVEATFPLSLGQEP